MIRYPIQGEHFSVGTKIFFVKSIICGGENTIETHYKPFIGNINAFRVVNVTDNKEYVIGANTFIESYNQKADRSW